MNPNLKGFVVCGVPEGFDVYGAGPKEINFFQSFYDGSPEENKLEINKLPNGRVVYTYKRSGLVGTRTGSFFAMSLIFENQYCKDVEKLYKLFDEVFYAVVKNGRLLKILSDGKTIGFAVKSFKDVSGLIDHIGDIMKQKIDEHFQNDFESVGNLFKQGVENLVPKINMKNGNRLMPDVINKYNHIQLSKDF